MKYLKSKCIQEAKGKKKGKYIITLEVSDYDLEMIEDFATTFAPFVVIEEGNIKNDFNPKCSTDYKKKYLKWIRKTYHEFWKLWKNHDKF